MKKLLSLIFICITITASAQSTVTWASPVTISGTTGYDFPRICLSNATPVISYGDFLTGNFYVTRFVSGSFTSPVQINPPGLLSTVNSITGPDMKSSGDTVFITFVDISAAHVYLQRSLDGGITFSDTIKVDNIGNNMPQYATVDIMPGGNPIIAFAKLTATFSNPQYVVTKSYDGGNAFLPDVDATAALGGDPCDCCPGNIIFNDNKVAVIFRNSINDLRDMRAAISTDTANSFSSVGAIDNNGWIFASCPSLGGDGIIQGDTLISVFMNGLNGNSCYVSTLNLITHQQGFQKKLFSLPGAGNQHMARIAGNGDTLGVVWDQAMNGSRYIMFSYSTTGAAGLGINLDTISDFITGAFHNNPDITYSNGKFYLVFNDDVAAQVYYMEGTVNASSALQEYTDDGISITAHDEYGSIKIMGKRIVNQPVLISVYDSQGKTIETVWLNSLQSSQVVKIKQKLTGGMYVISVSTKDFNVSKKLVMRNSDSK